MTCPVMQSIVAQATISPIKSTEPWNKKMSPERASLHNRMIKRLTDKWGFVTTKMLAEDQRISIDAAYAIVRHAAFRGYIKHEGTRNNLKRYVRAA